MDIITLILAAVAVILLVVLIIKMPKKDGNNQELISKGFAEISAKTDTVGATVSRELSSNRTETTNALSDMNKKLMDMTKNNYEQQQSMSKTMSDSLFDIRERNEKQSEKMINTMQTSVDKMIAGNEKKLEEMRATVDEKLTSTLTTRLDSSFKTVSEQLEKLYKSLGEMKELSGGVTANITSLNKILTNVKSRGTWAEYQLENILDQTIPNMYIKNFKPASCRDVVEFAVKIPSGDNSSEITYMPIDSKFPMEDYARLCEAVESADSVSADAARKALEKRVTEEAKTITKYINVPETTPFAIMYLATEGLYAEVASSKSGLLEKLQNDYSIMVAGPTTVTALLNSISMGFRTLAINEKANEIKIVLGAVKQQYDKFDDVLKKVKKKITEADQSIDDATKRNDIIQKKLKGIDAADSLAADDILGIPQDAE